MDVDISQDTKDLSLLLVGRDGNGKSSTGNSILGGKHFTPTSNCSSVGVEIKHASATVSGRKVTVTEVAGLEYPDADIEGDIEDTLKKVKETITENKKGFNAVIFVLKFGVRFTKQEKDALLMIRSIFGSNVVKDFGVVVMTNGDCFDSDEGHDKRTFEEWCKGQAGEVRDLFEDCENRCVLFNNRTKDEGKMEKQRELLFSKVTDINRLYTLKEYTKADKSQTEIVVQSKLPKTEQYKNNVMREVWEELSKIDSKYPAASCDFLELSCLLNNMEEKLLGLKKWLEEEDKNTGVLKQLSYDISVAEMRIHTKRQIVEQKLQILTSSATFVICYVDQSEFDLQKLTETISLKECSIDKDGHICSKSVPGKDKDVSGYRIDLIEICKTSSNSQPVTETLDIHDTLSSSEKVNDVLDPGSPPNDRGQAEKDSGQVEKDSGQTEKDSGQAEKESGQAEKDSGQAEKDSGQVEKDSGQAEKDSGQAEKDSGQVEKDSGQVEKDSGQTEKDSGQAEKDSGQTEKDSGQVEKDSGQVEKDSGQAEKDSGQVEKDSGQVEKDSGQVEKDSGQVEKDSGQAEKDSGQAEKESGQAEKESGQAEKDSGQAEKDSGQVEKDSGQVEKDRGQVEKDSGQAEKDSGQVEKDSGQVEKDRGQVEKDSGQAVKDRGQAEKDSGQAEKYRGQVPEVEGQDQQLRDDQQVAKGHGHDPQLKDRKLAAKVPGLSKPKDDLEATKFMFETIRKQLKHDNLNHVIYLISKYEQKLTKEEIDIVIEKVKTTYGTNEIKNHSILILTCDKDYLEAEKAQMLADWCQEETGTNQQLLKACGNRRVLLNPRPKNEGTSRDGGLTQPAAGSGTGNAGKNKEVALPNAQMATGSATSTFTDLKNLVTGLWQNSKKKK